jgi:hypothetical protein|tara:strand:- start:347 stop:1009 length:663 start_codon:yes stop_codon:yes gene_type:complete
MKVKIQVPESLREISLEQYQKYHKINTEDNKNSNFLLHKTIEIFCNLNLQNVIKVEFNSVVKVVNMINDLFTQDVKLVPTFTMDGVGYGFVPDLDKMTLGEYVDLDNTLGDWDNMHKAMAVLYRPIDDTYKDKYIIKDYDPDVDKDKYKQMPLDIVMGSIVFFYNLKNELLKTILKSLNQEVIKTLTIQQRETLLGSGDGITRYIDWLEEMQPKLMKLAK